jgi:hypothetical protein
MGDCGKHGFVEISTVESSRDFLSGYAGALPIRLRGDLERTGGTRKLGEATWITA